jgi:DNA modification methylase
LQIEKIPIKKINPAPYNPRKDLKPGDSEYDKLKRSILEFDMVEPLVWNKQTGNLVGGHQRLKILIENGETRVDCSVVDLSKSKEKALNIALNKIQGEWDFPKLRDLLLEIDTGEFDIDITGFDAGELEQLVASYPLEGGEAREDEFDVDKALEDIEEPKTKQGDIIEMGRHRLMCGDVKEDCGILAETVRFDLLVTDPPYGVSYANKNEFLNAIDEGNRIQTPIEGDDRTPEEMYSFWCASFQCVRPFMRDGACYYVTGPQGGDLLLLLLLALKECKFPLRHMLVWAKNNHVLGRSDYHYKHEPIIYGWVDGAGHKFYGGRGEMSVWEIPKPHKSELHPTMKPIELFSRAIRNGSKKGETVFDPFVGSGTTIIASEQLNRTCYAMEIDPKYCDVIVERWQTFTGKKAKYLKE